VVGAGSAGGTVPASRETEGNSDGTGSTGGTPPSANVLEESLGDADSTPRTNSGSSTVTGSILDGTGGRSARVGHGLEITNRAEDTEDKSEAGASRKKSDKR